MCVCVCVCIWRKREKLIHFKKLSYIILEAAKSKSLWKAGRLVTQERVDAAAWVQKQSTGKISFSEDISLFSLEVFNLLDEAHPYYEG